MGKFVNKVYTDTIDSLVDAQIKKYDNGYYTFIDKSPYIVDFYNLDNASTLSEGSRLSNSSIGPNSPFKYSYIKDAIIYLSGLKLELDYDYDEFGTQVNPVEGEAFVLPNTWVPVPNSFFIINHASKIYLFQITKVSSDTVDNGANFYKMQYSLYNARQELVDQLNSQVIKEYEMVTSNYGTEMKSIILKNDYDLVIKMDAIMDNLRQFYKDMFFKDTVQAFVYFENGKYFYDPYVVEFMIRNDIINGGKDSYEYITQGMYLPKTFSIEYDNSFLRCFETRNKEKMVCNNAFGKYIDDPNSLFSTRVEDYFRIIYSPDLWFNSFEPISAELVSNIQNGVYYTSDSKKAVYNIIIDYFNNPEQIICSKNIDAIDRIDFYPNRDLYYAIPMILYCMEYSVKNLLR